MKTEYGVSEGEPQQQQQQGSKQDLCEQYRTIGIPALSAATMFKRRDKEKAPQQQAAIFDYED
ncbi:hypothetical protein [Chthonobacter albigriseus]|uniref:hypothetical protein n=1 Tax=Chthonobacter albigriseus TaxID=1683161 RepID=UPI0015EEB337|nr:hypothetical protein [Chthonobacter albigriseus]